MYELSGLNKFKKATCRGLLFAMYAGETAYFPKGNFSIPFTVTGGRVNYFGDYFAVTRKGKIFLGEPGSGRFIVSNRYQQDYDLIKERFPALINIRVMDAMPDFVRNNTAYTGMYLKGINTP